MDAFYARLFAAAPAVKPLFANTDLKAEDDALGTLVLLRKSLRDLDAIVPKLRELGARHVAAARSWRHYPVVEVVLIASMAEIAGEGPGSSTSMPGARGIRGGRRRDDRGRRGSDARSRRPRRARCRARRTGGRAPRAARVLERPRERPPSARTAAAHPPRSVSPRPLGRRSAAPRPDPSAHPSAWSLRSARSARATASRKAFSRPDVTPACEQHPARAPPEGPRVDEAPGGRALAEGGGPPCLVVSPELVQAMRQPATIAR